MRTDDLIDTMAADARVVPRYAPQVRLAMTALAGAGLALALVLGWLRLRPDLAQAVSEPMFWTKALYTAALAAAAAWAVERLGRPAGSARTALLISGAVIAAFVLAGVFQFAGLAAADRETAWRGGSWTVCTRNIFVLGGPTTILALAVLRGLAPTRPVLTGFSAGLFAGGVAATVYGLHCPEASVVFVALWYTLGVLSCGALGAALGRLLLRW